MRSSSLIEALEALIANGADVNARDNSGETPLHCVRNLLREGLHERAAEVAHTLLVAGAHIDAANNKVSAWGMVRCSGGLVEQVIFCQWNCCNYSSEGRR